MTPATLRVLITGSRDWAAHAVAEQVIARLLARYGPNLILVHGGAKGVDLAFELAAKEHDLATEVHEANWTKHGRRAGPLRNEAMVNLGADLCIAVHRDLWGSKGTAGCVRLALAAGIPVWLIDSDDCVPRKITRDGAKG